VRDLVFDHAEMKEPKRRLKLVHFAVDAGSDHLFLARDAEVFQRVDPMLLRSTA
jgi:hypothetical protein